MKKVWILAAVMMIALLCGCQASEDTGADYGDDFSKAQEIAVIPAGTSEVTKIISSDEDIEAFVLGMDVENWKLAELPEGAVEVGTFGLSQEKTIRLGQTDTDGTLYDVATIILYEEPYITAEIVGLDMDMTFEVSKDAADHLKGYFE